MSNIPYRLDLAGGWIDQPFVSEYYPGSVITISIEPGILFNERSGMASSTRNRAIEIFGDELPKGKCKEIAKTLFYEENHNGSKYVSGSQDAIGIVYPGANRLHYDSGEYWPSYIESILDEDTLSWIERHLWFVELSPRTGNYDVFKGMDITRNKAMDLAISSAGLWKSIKNLNIKEFGKYMTDSFNAQVSMFPSMVNAEIKEIISYYRNAFGWKLSGAGGGGYLVVVSEKSGMDAFQIKIRRR